MVVLICQSLCQAEQSLESAVASERVAQAIQRTEQVSDGYWKQWRIWIGVALVVTNASQLELSIMSH